MNLLITGAWVGADKHIARLEAMGHSVVFQQQEADNLSCPCEWVEGVICNGLFLHYPVSLFTNLRFIQLTSAGYDRVPIEEISKRGIEIHNARGVYSIPMAEFAVAGVLNLLKDMDHFRRQQREHRWEKNRCLLELYGRRVVIIGAGNVGTECAKRFKAFGCEVVGVDERPDISKAAGNFAESEQIDLGEVAGAGRKNGKATGSAETSRYIRSREMAIYLEAFDRVVLPNRLDEVLPQADVVILALPLTERTHGLIDAERLAMMGQDCILVNISRGAVVDQSALEKWNGTAVLDVFEEEPLDPDSPLWDKENVIITPHNSFVGDGNEERLDRVIMENLRKAVNR